MSLVHGATIARDGLVFYYDQSNIQKSWEGAPATNLFTETNLNNWSKSATTSTSQLITPFGDTAYAITDSNTGAYSNISRNITVPNDSASYTVSLMVRKTTGGTSARLGFNIGFNGGTLVATNPRFNSDTGVGTGNSIDFGDWWYWYFTITNNSSGNTNLYCDFFPATGVHNGTDNPIGVGTAVIGSMMLVTGSIAARFVNGTRSNTQAILDLTGKNTITASSLTYASNNTFSFNGTSDFIGCGNNAEINFGTGNFTVSAWFKRAANATTNSRLLSKGGDSDTASRAGFAFVGGDSSINFTVNPNGARTTIAAAAYTVNEWVNVVGLVERGATMRGYKNGNLVGSAAAPVGSVSGALSLFIGNNVGSNLYWPGNIPQVSLYNRALSTEEVQQNFNALRGRYGI